jgi:hypothetical protein
MTPSLYQQAFGLSPGEAALLRLIHRAQGTLVPYPLLERAMFHTHTSWRHHAPPPGKPRRVLRAFVHRVNSKLGPTAAIATLSGQGLYLPETSLAALHAALSSTPTLKAKP